MSIRLTVFSLFLLLAGCATGDIDGADTGAQSTEEVRAAMAREQSAPRK